MRTLLGIAAKKLEEITQSALYSHDQFARVLAARNS